MFGHGHKRGDRVQVKEDKPCGAPVLKGDVGTVVRVNGASIDVEMDVDGRRWLMLGVQAAPFMFRVSDKGGQDGRK